MLEYLRIRNLALIEDMELEFGVGMNVLTGETGAGKSFILKALDFLLGEKLKADMIRPGFDRAHVEAVFLVHEPLDEDEDNSPSPTNKGKAKTKDKTYELLLRRELLASGRSRFYVNDALRAQDKARQLREKLISYTSQHGQQKLLQPSYQSMLMEQYLEEKKLLKEKALLLQKLEAVASEKESLEKKRAEVLALRDLLEIQQAEIDKVKPQPNEDIELEELRQRARAFEQSRADYETALGYLYGSSDNTGLMDLLSDFLRLLERMARQNEELQPSYDALLAMDSEVQALVRLLRHPKTLDDMPEDMDAIESRLFALSQLKRKLHRNLDEILALKDEIEEKISFLDVCELDIRRLRREEVALAEQLASLIALLKPLRRQACERFALTMTKQLAGLGFSDQAKVLPHFKDKECWPGISDEVASILWAPNPGQAPQPLDKIASGGELSRFLLALAAVLHIPGDATYIFDEVDSGVGGLTLNSLADRLHDLSLQHQMILVTHWPQIAVRANTHFQIRKIVREDKTYTLCTPLQELERHAELVRMAGGGKQGEALAQVLEQKR